MSDTTPRRRAVITGIGPISCIGIGCKAFWQGILSEKSGITRLTRFDLQGLEALSAGEINNFEPLQFLPVKSLRRLDRYAQFALSALSWRLLIAAWNSPFQIPLLGEASALAPPWREFPMPRKSMMLLFGEDSRR